MKPGRKKLQVNKDVHPTTIQDYEHGPKMKNQKSRQQRDENSRKKKSRPVR